MTDDQLTLDGASSRSPESPRRAPAFSEAQRAILGHIQLHGTIRSVEAGVIVHERRDRPCVRPATPSVGCCSWAASDGLDALKRLAARGFVQRVAAGHWEPVR